MERNTPLFMGDTVVVEYIHFVIYIAHRLALGYQSLTKEDDPVHALLLLLLLRFLRDFKKKFLWPK